MITIPKKKFDVSQHVLVPKHSKLSEKERKELFEKYRITSEELPMIKIGDAALANMDVELEDIIKIERPSPTVQNTVFYRRVVK